jgi:hypothetical protein
VNKVGEKQAPQTITAGRWISYQHKVRVRVSIRVRVRVRIRVRIR